MVPLTNLAHGLRLRLPLAAAATLLLILTFVWAGAAQAATIQQAAGTVPPSPFEYVGTVAGSIPDSETCEDLLAMGQCSDAVIEFTTSGPAEAVIRWANPGDFMLQSELDLWVLLCSDPIEVDLLGNPLPLQIANPTCTVVASGEGAQAGGTDAIFQESVLFNAQSTVDTPTEQLYYIVRAVPFQTPFGVGLVTYNGCVGFRGDCGAEGGGNGDPEEPVDTLACGTTTGKVTGGGKVDSLVASSEGATFAVSAQSKTTVTDAKGKLDYYDKASGIRLFGKDAECVHVASMPGDGSGSGTADVRGRGEYVLAGSNERRPACWVTRPADVAEPGRDRDEFQVEVYDANVDGSCSATLVYENGPKPIRDGNIQVHHQA